MTTSSNWMIWCITISLVTNKQALQPGDTTQKLCPHEERTSESEVYLRFAGGCLQDQNKCITFNKNKNIEESVDYYRANYVCINSGGKLLELRSEQEEECFRKTKNSANGNVINRNFWLNLVEITNIGCDKDSNGYCKSKIQNFNWQSALTSCPSQIPGRKKCNPDFSAIPEIHCKLRGCCFRSEREPDSSCQLPVFNQSDITYSNNFDCTLKETTRSCGFIQADSNWRASSCLSFNFFVCQYDLPLGTTSAQITTDYREEVGTTSITMSSLATDEPFEETTSSSSIKTTQEFTKSTVPITSTETHFKETSTQEFTKSTGPITSRETQSSTELETETSTTQTQTLNRSTTTENKSLGDPDEKTDKGLVVGIILFSVFAFIAVIGGVVFLMRVKKRQTHTYETRVMFHRMKSIEEVVYIVN